MLARWLAQEWCRSLATKAKSDVLVIGVVDCDRKRWQKPAEKLVEFLFWDEIVHFFS